MRLKKVITICGKRELEEDLVDTMHTENRKGGQPDDFDFEYETVPEIRC